MILTFLPFILLGFATAGVAGAFLVPLLFLILTCGVFAVFLAIGIPFELRRQRRVNAARQARLAGYIANRDRFTYNPSPLAAQLQAEMFKAVGDD